MDLEDYNQVPSICKTNNKTLLTQQPLRASKTPFSNESYYLIQGTYLLIYIFFIKCYYFYYFLKGDLIWHVDSLKNIERSKWPIKLFNIFPGVAENIDAILFDHVQNEYLIFKVILNLIKSCAE